MTILDDMLCASIGATDEASRDRLRAHLAAERLRDERLRAIHLAGARALAACLDRLRCVEVIEVAADACGSASFCLALGPVPPRIRLWTRLVSLVDPRTYPALRDAIAARRRGRRARGWFYYTQPWYKDRSPLGRERMVLYLDRYPAW